MDTAYRSKEEFGEFVENLRVEAGLTQEALTEALGMSQSAVCRVEKAQRGLALEELEAYSGYFGVSVDEMLRKETEGVVLMRAEQSDSEGQRAAVALLREVIRDYFGAEAVAW